MGLGDQIFLRARELGLDLVGIGPAHPQSVGDRYAAWLAKGYHGEMAYLARPDAVAARGDPARLLPGVRSVVVVGANYYAGSLPPALGNDPSRGVISRYAWGDDYHDLLVPRLRQLAAWVEAERGKPVAHRAYADTGPLLEREMAARAGLGFVGKNTTLIHPRLGSWLFLGALLLDVEIPPAGPDSSGRSGSVASGGTCGRCTRCLDACPTGALVAPYLLDARRCLSYLTIELKGPIPTGLRPLLGNRIFGCDVCQEVCPWNRRFARPTAEPAFLPRLDAGDPRAPHLLELMTLDDEGFRQRFRGSPVIRTKRRGLLRNVAVALGNWGDPAAVPALTGALADAEPLIREHAAWALGRIGSDDARRALDQVPRTETEGWV
jgi:epoxyqueuosine reductase